jgi:hypothetical protein
MDGSKRHQIVLFLICFVFAFSMAYLESAVVVYLRKIYYPHGFAFPMKIISDKIALIEIGRELATILMLVSVSILSTKTIKERIAVFFFIFGVWDLFYYFWLEVFLGWPHGFADWDILFLIPAPWIAPWSAPAIVALFFIIASVLVVLFPERFGRKIFSRTEWLFEILAAMLILYTFFSETGNVLLGKVPQNYPWNVFTLGIILGMTTFLYRFFKKTPSQRGG